MREGANDRYRERSRGRERVGEDESGSDGEKDLSYEYVVCVHECVRARLWMYVCVIKKRKQRRILS